MPSPPPKCVQLYSALPSRGSFVNARSHFAIKTAEFGQSQSKEVLGVMAMVRVGVKGRAGVLGFRVIGLGVKVRA